MNKETINEINNNLILLVEGFEDAWRWNNYDLANEKHYVSEIITLVKKLTLTDVSQQRELLIAELKEWDLGYTSFNNLEEKLAEKLLKAINCG